MSLPKRDSCLFFPVPDANPPGLQLHMHKPTGSQQAAFPWFSRLQAPLASCIESIPRPSRVLDSRGGLSQLDATVTNGDLVNKSLVNAQHRQACSGGGGISASRTGQGLATGACPPLQAEGGAPTGPISTGYSTRGWTMAAVNKRHAFDDCVNERTYLTIYNHFASRQHHHQSKVQLTRLQHATPQIRPRHHHEASPAASLVLYLTYRS